MRVRIVVPIHSFEPGGVERVALRLAGKWQTCGEEITVVLGRSTGAAGFSGAGCSTGGAVIAGAGAAAAVAAPFVAAVMSPSPGR